MLEIVDRRSDVVGNHTVTQAKAIHLNRKLDRDVTRAQGSGELHGGVPTQALPKDDDTRMGGAAAFDEFKGGRPVVVGDAFRVDIWRLAQSLH